MANWPSSCLKSDMDLPNTRFMFFICHTSEDLMGEMIAAAPLSVVPLCESQPTWAIHFCRIKMGTGISRGQACVRRKSGHG